MFEHRSRSDGSSAVHVALGALSPIGAAAALVAVRDRVDNVNVALALTVVVVASGALGGRRAGMASALTAAVSFDFFHTRPYRSVLIHDADDVEMTILLLVLGLIRTAARRKWDCDGGVTQFGAAEGRHSTPGRRRVGGFDRFVHLSGRWRVASKGRGRWVSPGGGRYPRGGAEMNSRSFHRLMASGRAEPTERPAWRRSTLIVTAAVAVLFTGVAAGGAAEGRVQQGSGVVATAENESAAPREPFARLDPAAFEERMKNEQAMVINVHIPYEGELAGTDAFIPYDKIRDDPRLPEDKNTELLLYCKSGRMSEEAGVDLHEEGYTNIAHLEGGMKAWEASGRKVIYNPENAARQSGPHKPHKM